MFDLEKRFKKLEIGELLKGSYDTRDAIISIYAGVGGDDAGDWARMLGEMYIRYAQNKNWKTRIIDTNVIEIKGEYAYGFLKGEMGVHRLVRMSPFSAKQLRHTSFALVEILPDLPTIEVQKFSIPEDDLKFEFSRSGGAGGQNVNKVETKVRIVHIPTGVWATSQVERSQSQNRERALTLLKAKLLQRMETAKAKELGDLRTKAKPEWGSQIRSYVLNPYKMVKDHRTNVETTNVSSVLEEGLLDTFIEAELELYRNEK